MSIEALKFSLHFFVRLGKHFSIHRRTRHETVPGIIESDEATAPHHRKSERLRIEDRRLVPIETHADPLRNHQTRAFEDATEKVAVILLGPATVFPRVLIVLIAPMTLLATIHPGKGRDQSRQRLLLHEVQRLLPVVVEHPLAVHEFLPVLVVVLVQRREVRCEGRRHRSLHHLHPSIDLIKVPKPQRVVHAQARQISPTRFHHAPRNPRVIDETIATELPLDELTESQPDCARSLSIRNPGGTNGFLANHLPINPKPNELRIHTDDEVMPLAVTDIDARIIVATEPRHVERQRAALGMGVELPVRRR